MKRIRICMLMVLAALYACEKTEEEKTVQISTGETIDVSAYSATLGGTAVIHGYETTSRLTFGFILSEESLPDLNNGTVYNLSGILSEQSFSAIVDNLSPETCYYYVAFVKIGNVSWTGAVRSFMTMAGDVPKGAVDLGLSVLWAEKNVGADAPEQFGDYYAWGELEPKKVYTWGNYRFNGGYEILTKYCTDGRHGKDGLKDDILILEPDDDVARIAWGKTWRMPSKDEFEELLSTASDETNYTWTWTEINGHKGWSITYKANQASIFFPAAGFYKSYADTYYRDGFYWTSSLYAKNPLAAWAACHQYQGTRPAMEHKGRDLGYPIRPVMDKNGQ